MACYSSEQEINDFLKKVKYIMDKPNKFQLIKRRKNMISLNKHGLSIEDVKMHIRHLTVSDYSSGPDEDRDKPGYVWIFGKVIDNKMFYLKLKIRKDVLVLCISFHNALYDINFPYK